MMAFHWGKRREKERQWFITVETGTDIFPPGWGSASLSSVASPKPVRSNYPGLSVLIPRDWCFLLALIPNLLVIEVARKKGCKTIKIGGILATGAIGEGYATSKSQRKEGQQLKLLERQNWQNWNDSILIR
jgi:hypothetical protein